MEKPRAEIDLCSCNHLKGQFPGMRHTTLHLRLQHRAASYFLTWTEVAQQYGIPCVQETGIQIQDVVLMAWVLCLSTWKHFFSGKNKQEDGRTWSLSKTSSQLNASSCGRWSKAFAYGIVLRHRSKLAFLPSKQVNINTPHQEKKKKTLKKECSNYKTRHISKTKYILILINQCFVCLLTTALELATKNPRCHGIRNWKLASVFIKLTSEGSTPWRQPSAKGLTHHRRTRICRENFLRLTETGWRPTVKC